MADLMAIIAKLDKATADKLHGEILECSIAASTGGSYRAKLAVLRMESKGGLKKIYAAMYKASPERLVSMADVFVAEFGNRNG